MMKPFLSLRRAVRAFGLAAGLLALPVRADDVVPLAGTWRFQLDRADAGQSERWFARALTEHIELPGALQNQGFGEDISTNTAWTGQIGVERWLKLPQYEKYRQPGNVKLPFFLQPEKHYVGAAWYQRDIEIPAGWQGRRVLLTLERPHWEKLAGVAVEVIGENRTIPAHDGVFEDQFNPWDVHLYRIPRLKK